jgi:hypothetical protein
MTTPTMPARWVAQVRAICVDLPDSHEEDAWVGVRWRVHSRTFAHVLTISDGWPPAYARAAGVDSSAHVLMFRSAGAELEALRDTGWPFFGTPWRPDEVGVHLTDQTDWTEITELLTESYCIQAPQRLVSRVQRPNEPPPPGGPRRGRPDFG